MEELLVKISEVVKNYYHIDSNTLFSVETIPSSDLIVPQRLDVLIKLYYVEAKVKGYNMEFAKELYTKHISSITRFTNSENGQDDKNNINDFITTFDKLIDSFQRDGFNDNLSLIPISSEGIILDGAHRLACAIYFGKPVKVIRFPHIGLSGEIKPGIYDYQYFKNFLLEQKYLDVAVHSYIKYSRKNIYIACLWPKADNKEKRELAKEIIGKNHPIIASKEVRLSFFAFDKFVAQVYMHDDWVGSIENNFSGSQGKSKLTYKEGSHTTFIVFEGVDKDDTLRLKDEVRSVFNIEKHSIHITDNVPQTKFLVDIVFNENSLLFLEYSNPGKFSKDVRNLFELNSGKMYGPAAAQTIWGLQPYNGTSPFLTDADLKEIYNIESINYIPGTQFFYLGMKLFMPEKGITSKFLKTEPNGKVLTFSQLHNRRFDKLKYKISIFMFNLKSSIYAALVNQPRLLSLARKTKELISH